MHANGKICFGDFEVDTTHRLLRRSGEAVALSAKAFDVLAYLVENAGRVVTKNEILDAVWENQFVEEANLKVQISALRKALGEQKNEHRFLITLPGTGYKFVGDIHYGATEIVFEKHKISHVVVDRETEISDPDPFPRESRPALSPLSFAVIAIVTISIAGAGLWLLNRNNEKTADAASLTAPDLKTKQLTNNGRVNRVKLSPDGRFFAYSTRELSSFETEIRIGQTDGSSDVVLRPLTSGVSHYPLSFSADGTWLYYVEIPPVSEYTHPEGLLYKTPVLSGVPQKLGDSISVFSVIAPDEKHLAFARNRGDRSAIVVANLDGSDEREIAVRASERSIDPETLAWSADGQFLSFAAPVGPRRTDASNRNYEIYVVRVADDSVEQLTSLEWNGVGVLEWLKDGAGLIASARSNDQYNNSSLWLISYPDGKVQRLSRDVSRYSWISLSADSKSLAVLQSPIETNIWIAGRDNISAAKQITFSTRGRQDGWYGMDWTADGRIVYTAWIDESLTLWIVGADGQNARQLTSIGFRDEMPAASADGKFIVFQSNRSGATEIWRMSTDGSDLQQITTDGGNTYASLTPDNLWVVYRHSVGGNSSLRRIPVSGGQPLKITDNTVYTPRVSPDGKFVAYAGTFDMRTRVAVIPVEGGNPTILFDVPETHNFRRNTILWSPDGKALFYPDEKNGIWVQNLVGGPPSLLQGIPPEATFSFSWSKDGNRFAFGRHREVRDVVLLTNFR